MPPDTAARRDVPGLRRFRPVALVLLVAACGPPEEAIVPITDAGRDAPPPRLAETASFDAELAAAAPDAAALEAASSELAARAAALRARAAGLEGPVLDPDARERLEAAGR